MSQNRQLAYYASLLPGKESQYQTPGEGYRIYKDVPIARTGSQEYLGKELKRNRAYRPEWNLKDEQSYRVYRPLDEVTSPATLASFEGKSVLDEHPSGDRVLIDALDEYEGISKGHGQNVRVGAKLPDGETPLVADLHVKHPDLNVKVDEGIREVSCGYTYLLGKDASGRLIQTQIRGNHIAIVPRGRAGSQVGIKDSALEKEGITMAGLLRRIKALGFVSWAKDAKPEDVESVIDELMPEDGEGDGMTIKELLQKSVASQGSYGLSRFSSLATAKEYANRANGIYRVVMGDDGKYWVAPARIASQLIAGGYEAADAEEFNKKGEQDMYKGAKDEQHPQGCYCADCRGEKDAAHPDGCRCDDCIGSGDGKKGVKDADGVEAENVLQSRAATTEGRKAVARAVANAFRRTSASSNDPRTSVESPHQETSARKDAAFRIRNQENETMAEDGKGAKDSDDDPDDNPEVEAAMDAESEFEKEVKEDEGANDYKDCNISRLSDDRYQAVTKGGKKSPALASPEEVMKWIDENTEGSKDSEEAEEKAERKEEDSEIDFASIISPDGDYDEEEPTFTAIDALALVGKIAPVVARSNNAGAVDALNTLRDKLTLARDGAKDGQPDPFRSMARAGATVDSAFSEQPDMLSFFNGRPYHEGLKAWNEYLANSGK